jgi:hypothetical protein
VPANIDPDAQIVCTTPDGSILSDTTNYEVGVRSCDWIGEVTVSAIYIDWQIHPLASTGSAQPITKNGKVPRKGSGFDRRRW